MTISTTTISKSYSGNGSTHSFAYDFKIFADADLTVIIRSSTGTETVKTLNTHYVVTGAGVSSGGTVLFKFNTGNASDAHYSTSDFRPASGETVVIRSELANTQTMDLVANDPFPAETLETNMDKLVRMVQQHDEELGRSLKLSRTNTMTSTEFTTSATDRASKLIAFDTSGELSIAQEIGEFQGDWAASTAYVQRDIVKDTSTNNIFIVNAAHTSSGSQPLTTNANSAKYDLLVDAASATTSQTAAATSATAAATSATAAASSATAAATSATTATTQASNASTSASTASTQASNAASSATSAATSYDNFDDRYLGAKSSDPSADNDGDSLITGALYFNTTNNVMMVYTGSAWVRTTPTSSDQTNINTLAASAVVTDMSLLATTDVIADMALLADSDVIADMNTLATSDIISDLNTLATSDIVTDMNLLATSANVTNMATLGASGVVGNIATVAGISSNVTTVANNVSGVNSFADRYRIASSAPTSSLDVGDLYFDTTANELKVYKSSGWAAAGSTINGTSARFTYNISGTPTSVTGSDANGNTLAYDAGFIDVFLNGVKQVNGTDVTVTSGDTVTFASALADGDVVDIVGFGTFNVAAINASNINAGTVASARLGGAIISAWETKTSAFNVEAGRGYFVDTSSSAVTATLPASPSAGDTVRFIDLSATFDTNNLTVARNSKKIQGDASDLTVATERAGLALVFSGDTQGWLLMEK